MAAYGETGSETLRVLGAFPGSSCKGAEGLHLGYQDRGMEWVAELGDRLGAGSCRLRT